jgi:hypothetical protein
MAELLLKSDSTKRYYPPLIDDATPPRIVAVFHMNGDKYKTVVYFEGFGDQNIPNYEKAVRGEDDSVLIAHLSAELAFCEKMYRDINAEIMLLEEIHGYRLGGYSSEGK